MNRDNLIERIRSTVKETDAQATLILYGSYARNEERADSDIDLLILLKKDRVTREDEKRMAYPLYEIEFETGILISPLVLSRRDWETRHRPTPFYEHVKREGRVLIAQS
jgi:predicted nucleotidyltransferase